MPPCLDLTIIYFASVDMSDWLHRIRLDVLSMPTISPYWLARLALPVSNVTRSMTVCVWCKAIGLIQGSVSWGLFPNCPYSSTFCHGSPVLSLWNSGAGMTMHHLGESGLLSNVGFILEWLNFSVIGKGPVWKSHAICPYAERPNALPHWTTFLAVFFICQKTPIFFHS